MKRYHLLIHLVFILIYNASAQTIQEVLPKIKHAEPLYIDLVRDLGARKGEREWNVGWGFSKNDSESLHAGFIEYEFSPFNRLGLEIETPFAFNQPHAATGEKAYKIEGVKIATQYTFLVNESRRISAAIGYMQEFEFHNLFPKDTQFHFWKGNIYSPFFIVAKRLGTNFHSMIYTGPIWEQDFTKKHTSTSYQINISTHFTVPGTSNFLGIEVNELMQSGAHNLTIRPQIKIKLNNSSAIGFSTGIPITNSKDNLSFLVRFIFEPQGKKRMK